MNKIAKLTTKNSKECNKSYISQKCDYPTTNEYKYLLTIKLH